MQDPFIGTWILNVENSQFDANHRPQAGTIVLELDPEGYYLQKAEGVNEKGEKVVERPQRYIADGQDHPIPGMPGLSYRATRTSNTLTGEARREDGSIVGGATKIVSPGGKSMTVDNFGYDTQMRQFKMRTVWTRQ